VVSIGFPSAVNEGALTIPKFLNTAQSCNRYFLVEVMGQRYGLLTLGIAYSASRGRAQHWRSREELPVSIGGVFTEIPRSLQDIPQLMAAQRAAGQSHGVILIGEGVQFHEASPPRETDGQNRVLIEAGDISRWVRQKLLERPYQVNGTRSVSLGYTLRGAHASQGDLNLAAHLARGALELVQGGSFGRMVGMDFLPGETRWTRVYPRLSEVIGRPVSLDPQYFEHIRASVEEAMGH
jgi:6-phosphofructokinase 1